jgi:hypothetical protein
MTGHAEHNQIRRQFLAESIVGVVVYFETVRGSAELANIARTIKGPLPN